MQKSIIIGEPRGKARPRFKNTGKFIQTYTDRETREYEKKVKKSYVGEITENNVMAVIEAYYSIPKNTSKKTREAMLRGDIRPSKKPDVDNIAKIILDGLNGVAYIDDKQVVMLCVRKAYSNTPRVEVSIEEV